jgi:hypothetical protein
METMSPRTDKPPTSCKEDFQDTHWSDQNPLDISDEPQEDDYSAFQAFLRSPSKRHIDEEDDLSITDHISITDGTASFATYRYDSDDDSISLREATKDQSNNNARPLVFDVVDCALQLTGESVSRFEDTALDSSFSENHHSGDVASDDETISSFFLNAAFEKLNKCMKETSRSRAMLRKKLFLTSEPSACPMNDDSQRSVPEGRPVRAKASRRDLKKMRRSGILIRPSNKTGSVGTAGQRERSNRTTG